MEALKIWLGKWMIHIGASMVGYTYSLEPTIGGNDYMLLTIYEIERISITRKGGKEVIH